jgi:hypothetical protein
MRKMQHLILDQVTYIDSLDGEISSNERKGIAQLQREIARIDMITPRTPDTVSMLGIPARYWRDLNAYEPGATADSVRLSSCSQRSKPDVPSILILQGERDYQVTMVDFELWKIALGKKASYVSYPSLNHLFESGTVRGGPSDYETPSNVARSVIDDIARFVLAH